MIPCIENCKYQKNGECTYETISSKIFTTLSSDSASNSNCAYFEQE